MDVVDLKLKVKNKEIKFFLHDGYIYCKNNKTEEYAIVGHYHCIDVSANRIRIIDENHNVMYLNKLNDKPQLIYISENVDLSLLQTLGFKLREEDGHYVKKVYLCNEDDDKNFYDIDPKTRILKLTRLDGDLDDTIINLVKAGFIR